MQKNCQKLKLPFEVLIQGPTGNRFIRSLIHADPLYESILDVEPIEQRKTRSTITIYRPENEAEGEQVQEVQQIESDAADTDGNADLEATDDIVTMTHQMQDEPLKSEAAEGLPLQADEDELTLDEDETETKRTGAGKREALFDEDAAFDSLIEESVLNKREADETVAAAPEAAEAEPEADVGSPINVIVQPAPLFPAPAPPPAKAQAVADAINKVRTNLQTLKNNVADKREQIKNIVGSAITDVRDKINALPKTPLPALPPLPNKAPAAPLPALPPLRKWFNKDDSKEVGVAANVVPNPPKPVAPVIPAIPAPKAVAPVAVLPIGERIAVRKAAVKANFEANKAALIANGLLPVVIIEHVQYSW